MSRALLQVFSKRADCLRQLAAILHLTPEAAADDPLARLQDGDWIELDAAQNLLRVELHAATLAARPAAAVPSATAAGYGLRLFAQQRCLVGPVDQGAWEP